MKHTENPTLSRVISKDGTEIGYFTSGEGLPLLLVHGGLGDHTRWGALLPYLEAHFSVHALDRRGRGASSDHADYTIERETKTLPAWSMRLPGTPVLPLLYTEIRTVGFMLSGVRCLPQT